MLMAACVLAACSGRPPSPRDLLRARAPSHVHGVRHPERINDGVTPADGDLWLTDLSAVFADVNGEVVYDLGRDTAIAAAFVQADNNDRFVLEVSDDGAHYRRLWQAGAVPQPGMRGRMVRGLRAHGRYLRLTAIGGDSLVSVGELMVFAQAPQPWPPRLWQRFGLPPYIAMQRWWIALGVALLLLLLAADRRVPVAVLAGAGLLAAIVLGLCVKRLAADWPPVLEIGEALRAVIAAVAGLALIAFSVRWLRVRPAAVHGVLGVLALLGAACFYNFGRPWFWNAERGRPTVVHTYDMRVYFPVAKYFDELGFDGVYTASVKAYMVGQRVPASTLSSVLLRDLRSYRVVRAGEVMDQIDAVPRRFTKQRWDAFVADMRFFWRTMGPNDYLGSLLDHGGNATPVWLAQANLLFRGMRASEPALTATALLDPLLMLLTFFCIARSFGLRTMLVCAIVFGATDFPIFGSDWAGSTLRCDWMATLGLGCCALKSGRYALGGALLAHAGLVRAFPAIALVFAPLPWLWQLVPSRRPLGRSDRTDPQEHGKAGRMDVSPSSRLPAFLLQLRSRVLPRISSAAAPPTALPGRALLRLVAGAAAASVLLVGLSCAMFGFEPAWLGWAKKIELHTEDPHTNHVGVRAVTAFDPAKTADALAAAGSRDPWADWQRAELGTYQRRQPLVFALRLLFTLLALLACRGATPAQAALIGLTLVPVFSYPANYYLHYVFLLPLLAVGRRPGLGLWLELTLLAMCVAQFFTLKGALDVRFFWESVILLVGFAALLFPLARVGAAAQVVAANPAIPSSS